MSGAARFVLPYQTVIDATGTPIPGGLLFFYSSGTSNPLNTYADSALTIPNPNPVQADAGGQFPNIFMQAAAYKVVLTDSLLNQIWTADPVTGIGGGGAGSVGLRTVTGNATVLASDQVLEVDASLGPVTITYPLGLGNTQQVQPVTIVKIDNTANNVSIVDSGSATVRFVLALPPNGVIVQSATVYSNGTTLRIQN